jgi:hypothetical protein
MYIGCVLWEQANRVLEQKGMVTDGVSADGM